MLQDMHVIFNKVEETTMGSLSRVTAIGDLPADEQLIDYIQQAVALNEQEVKTERKPAAPKSEIAIPHYFTNALSLNPEAKATFEQFSAPHRREYLECITEAKTEDTR